MVYCSTYIANNCTETICINRNVDPFYYKFFITFLTNMSSSIYKDKRLTVLFGKIAPKPFPLRSYGIFCLRDSLIIGSAFNLPKKVGEWIHKKYHVD